MNLINERSLIRRVAQNWAVQYSLTPAHRGHRADIHKSLLALNPETATAAEVEAIVGNNSWTAVPHCDECGAAADQVVGLGEALDHDSAGAFICRECLVKALEFMTSGGK